ncbi:MAG: Oligopeptide transport ATP-binding protein AppD [Pseudonocardiales bacterium]|nr:Oligopeptide transport ATP-binding protein AppD [Pseudonocardiales bacterium]
MTNLLRVRHLTIDAPGPIRLVDGIDLDMAAGERVALVGESGSGKTVLARAIMRLTKGLRVEGSVSLDGEELTAFTDRQMTTVRGRRIGMVFQDPLGSLNPLMTIGAQIAEPLRMAGVSRRAAAAKAADLLGELGVTNASTRLAAYPHEFSGGMRQRVALAIALVGEPDLLIADEPTTALDVRTQQQVLDLLDRVATERNLAVLMITHDLGVVAGFADRVVVMYAGRTVHQDGVEALFAAPAHPYTAALLEAIPRLDHGDQRLQPIPGAPPHPAQRPTGCPFHPRCRYAQSDCQSVMPATTLLPDGGTVNCHHPLLSLSGVAS